MTKLFFNFIFAFWGGGAGTIKPQIISALCLLVCLIDTTTGQNSIIFVLSLSYYSGYNINGE